MNFVHRAFLVLFSGVLFLAMIGLEPKNAACLETRDHCQARNSQHTRPKQHIHPPSDVSVRHTNVAMGTSLAGLPMNRNVMLDELVSAQNTSSQKPRRSALTRQGSEEVWRSEELKVLGAGIGVGDVDGDGKNDVVVIDPGNVYLYRFDGNNMSLITEYSAGALELKSVDVARIRKQGASRIYVSAQNRGNVSSFVLEFRNGHLVPVIQECPYFLRVLLYPTQGPILLGQKKSMRRMYEGPVYRIADTGGALEPEGRFGVPLKIPIFGFTIGAFAGNRQPLIAVYDKTDHLRIYDPSGKRLYVSKNYYGGSDIILRWAGPEQQPVSTMRDSDTDRVFFRPRIMSLDPDGSGIYQILVISHSSKTMRVLTRTKMLEEGRVEGLVWNGDALETRWRTPNIQGMLTDFAVDRLPGLSGLRLITLERKKTDWLSFLRSRSMVRAYELQKLISEGTRGDGTRDSD